MKKALKLIGKILLGFIILDIIIILIMFVYNRIMLSKEDKLLENYPGQLVEVDGHNMNVFVEGEGTHTLVFLSPSQDTSPAISFKPLYSKLSDDFVPSNKTKEEILDEYAAIHKTKEVTTTHSIDKIDPNTDTIIETISSGNISSLTDNLYELSQPGTFKVTITSTVVGESPRTKEYNIVSIYES